MTHERIIRDDPPARATLSADEWRKILTACARRREWLAKACGFFASVVGKHTDKAPVRAKLTRETCRFLMVVCMESGGQTSQATITELCGRQLDLGHGDEMTLLAGDWRSILEACQKRGEWLTKASEFITGQIGDREGGEAVTVAHRTSTFAFLLDVCLAEEESTFGALVARLSEADFVRPGRESDPEDDAAMKEQIKVAESIIAEYGDDPVPLPEKPGKATPTQIDNGQRSLFGESGVMGV